MNHRVGTWGDEIRRHKECSYLARKVEITSKEGQEEGTWEKDLLANAMITDRRHGLKVIRKGKWFFE